MNPSDGPVEVWGLTPPPSGGFRKIAAVLPVTDEVFEDNRVSVLAEHWYGLVQESMADIFTRIEDDERLTREIGPVHRPNWSTWWEITRPEREHAAKVAAIRSFLRWERGRPAGRFRRAPQR